MKNLILAVLAIILLISCNYKNIKLEPNDIFYHKYGYSVTKWIVIDALDNGVIAYSEEWLPSGAIFVSYSDLSFADEFKITGKYKPITDNINKEVDTNIYSSIVQKVFVKSYADDTYYVSTQIWCDNKQRTALALEYWEQKTVTWNNVETTKKNEFTKAEKVKSKIDRLLLNRNKSIR